MKMLNCKGKRVRFTVQHKTVRGHVEDCVHQQESKNRWLVLQRLDFSESGLNPPVRFRVGYYVLSKDSKLVWARNSPIFRREALKALIQKAQSRKSFFEI